VTRCLGLFAFAALIAAASAIGAKAQTPDATPATKEQAVAMVQKAVAFLKAQGPEKGYAEIDNKSGQFVQGDLYIAVVGLDGTLLAYGADGHRVGDT
jgi:cytochrome c